MAGAWGGDEFKVAHSPYNAFFYKAKALLFKSGGYSSRIRSNAYWFPNQSWIVFAARFFGFRNYMLDESNGIVAESGGTVATAECDLLPMICGYCTCTLRP